jgi:hypothetical protein
LFLIRLEQLSIRTPLWSYRGGQDGPPVRVLGGDQGLWVYDEAIADLHLGVPVQVVETKITPQLASADDLRGAETAPLPHEELLHTRR